MRFIIGKHYRDAKVRDGEEIYIATSLDVDIGNLVNIRNGGTFFMEDAPLYQYEGEGTVFDNTAVTQNLGDPERFQPCEVIITLANDLDSDGG
jgi:hypothetical protein